MLTASQRVALQGPSHPVDATSQRPHSGCTSTPSHCILHITVGPTPSLFSLDHPWSATHWRLMSPALQEVEQAVVMSSDLVVPPPPSPQMSMCSTPRLALRVSSFGLVRENKNGAGVFLKRVLEGEFL